MHPRYGPPTELSPTSGTLTVAEYITFAVHRLRKSSDTPQLEAEVLLAHVMGCSRAYLHAHPEIALHPNQLDYAHTLVERRALGEPLPYIIRKREFHGLQFFVDGRVFIPRPETETLVDNVLGLLGSPLRPGPMRRSNYGMGWQPILVDVGTGSGCIAIALALLVSDARVYAIDISADALAVARENAEAHRVAEKITFLQSDLLEKLPERVDLVISNPPYIAAAEWPSLPREVREYEPPLALDGGQDGLDCVRRLLDQATGYLRPGGAVFVEIGASQSRAAIGIARASYPGAEITVLPDLANRSRVIAIQTLSVPGNNVE